LFEEERRVKPVLAVAELDYRAEGITHCQHTSAHVSTREERGVHATSIKARLRSYTRSALLGVDATLLYSALLCVALLYSALLCFTWRPRPSWL
jgi:hypothetical protein